MSGADATSGSVGGSVGGSVPAAAPPVPASGAPGAGMPGAGMPGAGAAGPVPPSSAVPGRAELAAAQARLVGALVSGGPPPPGFDPDRLAVVARALLRKRAGAVARAWPRLAAGHGASWYPAYTAWAAGRPTRGAWRDGLDFARQNRSALTPPAAIELAMAEAAWVVTDEGEARRRGVAVRRVPGGLVLFVFGRLRLVCR